MAIQVGQVSASKWVPHYDLTFLAARSYEFMLFTVDKAVDTFLMEIESFAFVLKTVDVVNVN
jgi:hypothetical protein